MSIDVTFDSMWPILMQFLRTNAPYITLPIAAVVGIIGYNLESLLSDRYTPYNKPVQDQRFERMTEEDSLKDPTNVKKLKYQENVLGKNIPPSLEKH
ncbi:small integral membrane protein 12-A isoform X1 [Papilio machaon]|uniref:small integral membrane protein 12-A isoform X1 n=1 Tax=Papilio machaon TaxID=76193 RepID=UPI0006EAFE37|nr:small integral membrane protein 12-A isoform X1 [Papilio machaon]